MESCLSISGISLVHPADSHLQSQQHANHVRIVSKDIEQISAVLQAYQEAINMASAEDCAKLYTQDGVAMPQHFPTCVGMANVRKTYEDLFEITEFDIKIDIQEIVPVSPEYAFARKHRENICSGSR